MLNESSTTKSKRKKYVQYIIKMKYTKLQLRMDKKYFREI